MQQREQCTVHCLCVCVHTIQTPFAFVMLNRSPKHAPEKYVSITPASVEACQSLFAAVKTFSTKIDQHQESGELSRSSSAVSSKSSSSMASGSTDSTTTMMTALVSPVRSVSSSSNEDNDRAIEYDGVEQPPFCSPVAGQTLTLKDMCCSDELMRSVAMQSSSDIASTSSFWRSVRTGKGTRGKELPGRILCRRVIKELAARTLEPGVPMSEQNPYKMGLCIAKVQELLPKAHYQSHEVRAYFSRLLTRRGSKLPKPTNVGSAPGKTTVAVSPLASRETPVGDGHVNKFRSQKRAEQHNIHKVSDAVARRAQTTGSETEPESRPSRRMRETDRMSMGGLQPMILMGHLKTKPQQASVLSDKENDEV